jgi:hypothetical protein
MVELSIDPERRESNGNTGIYVRARDGEGWGIFDIVHLDKPSLLAWLRSRGGANEWAENTVGLLLGHGPLHSLGIGRQDK